MLRRTPLQRRTRLSPRRKRQRTIKPGRVEHHAWVELLQGWPLGWTDASTPCAGIWPGWPMGMGPDQHPYEPPRTVPKGSLKGRAARLKMLGNGVVPQQAATAFLTIFHFALEA